MLAIRGLLLAGCSLASILLSGGTALAHDQPRATQHVRAFSATGLRKVDERMRQAIEDGDAAGMVTLLGRVGEQIQLRSYGVQSGLSPMTPRSLFRIYSMTKPITGVAMMQLYEQGKWRLDDPVSLHVPDTERTRNLIGARELDLMKPGASLINNSRGRVVDLEAMLRFYRELSYREIAHVLSIPEGTVMSRLFHARRRLRDALGPQYAEEFGHQGGRRGASRP